MILDTTYQGRRAAMTENDCLRVTVLQEGGHLAEIFDKDSGISPLWIPNWPSIEPSSFDPVRHREYGTGAEARLLAGIMGHNLCLDLFGGPSDDETAAGLTVHGEGPVVPYEIAGHGDELVARAALPLAQLRFERRIAVCDRVVRIREIVQNLASHDRPVGWTQHVTLGPPFLEAGATEFRSSATQSQVYRGTFGDDDYLQQGVVFDWPHAPGLDGGRRDLQRFTAAPRSSAYGGTSDGSSVPACLFRGVLTAFPSRDWLRVETGRLPLDGHLGREPKQEFLTLERRDDRTRHGIRNVSVSRNATPDDRARDALRHAGVRVDSGERAGRDGILGACSAHVSDPGIARLAGPVTGLLPFARCPTPRGKILPMATPTAPPVPPPRPGRARFTR
jgi:hypothetical protein